MPTVTEQTMPGWAHCEDSMCDGNAQQSVEVVRRTVSHTYVENGGDFPGFERSSDYIVFAHESDRACPVCGSARAVAVQERPVYPTSQYAQDGLLKIIKEGMVKPMGELAQQRGDEIDALKALLAEQQEQIHQLLAAQEPAKRGPGRPPKAEPDA